MDPATAFVLFATELLKLANVVVASQTPDQQKQIWDWYIADVTRVRKLLGLDEEDEARLAALDLRALRDVTGPAR